MSQSTRNPSIDLFTLWGNTRGYTSITHISHKYDWTTASSALLTPSSLMIRDYPLIVSRDVTNDPIPRSAGTTLVYGRTLQINPYTCKTYQGIFSGIYVKMEAHLDWWNNVSLLQFPVQVGCMLSPTTWQPDPSLFASIW